MKPAPTFIWPAERAGLRLILEQAADIEVVGEAASGVDPDQAAMDTLRRARTTFTPLLRASIFVGEAAPPVIDIEPFPVVTPDLEYRSGESPSCMASPNGGRSSWLLFDGCEPGRRGPPPADAVTATLCYAGSRIGERNWESAGILAEGLPGDKGEQAAALPYSGGMVSFALKTQTEVLIRSPFGPIFSRNCNDELPVAEVQLSMEGNRPARPACCLTRTSN